MMRRTLSSLLPLVVIVATFWLAGSGTAWASPVPELDPGSSASGSALLIGGALFLIERYRKR